MEKHAVRPSLDHVFNMFIIFKMFDTFIMAPGVSRE